MLQHFNESSIYIFSNPTQEGEIKGPTLEDMASLSFCDVSQSIQYPGLSPVNQELALELIQKDDDRIQEEEAKKQLEQAEIDMENISNAWFFIKVVDFLYDALASMSILTKAGQYAGGVLMTLSSLFKGYFSSNKMEAVSAKDYSPQPMSPEKAKLAKCLVKILNENEALSKEINKKFNECIERYTQCQNDEAKQSIVKQFSEWIISETNLKNELLAFEAESHISDESYNSSESTGSSNNENGGGQSPANPSDPNPLGNGKPGGNGRELANTDGINKSSETQLTNVNLQEDNKSDDEAQSVTTDNKAKDTDLHDSRITVTPQDRDNRAMESNKGNITIIDVFTVVVEGAITSVVDGYINPNEDTQKLGNSFMKGLQKECGISGVDEFIDNV